MKSNGELHNEMIVDIMTRVEISPETNKEQKKEFLLQGFVDGYGIENKEIFEQGLNFTTPYEILDAVKDKMSLEFYTFLKQDIDYLLENYTIDGEEYFNQRLSEAKLDDRELTLYKDCSSIFINSVQLWSSDKGMDYNDTLYTPEAAAKRPPTREQVVGTIGAHDWVGGVLGGILGGPAGVVIGAAGASIGSAMSHSVHYN